MIKNIFFKKLCAIKSLDALSEQELKTIKGGAPEIICVEAHATLLNHLTGFLKVENIKNGSLVCSFYTENIFIRYGVGPEYNNKKILTVYNFEAYKADHQQPVEKCTFYIGKTRSYAIEKKGGDTKIIRFEKMAINQEEDIGGLLTGLKKITSKTSGDEIEIQLTESKQTFSDKLWHILGKGLYSMVRGGSALPTFGTFYWINHERRSGPILNAETSKGVKYFFYTSDGDSPNLVIKQVWNLLGSDPGYDELMGSVKESIITSYGKEQKDISKIMSTYKEDVDKIENRDIASLDDIYIKYLKKPIPRVHPLSEACKLSYQDRKLWYDKQDKELFKKQGNSISSKSYSDFISDYLPRKIIDIYHEGVIFDVVAEWTRKDATSETKIKIRSYLGGRPEHPMLIVHSEPDILGVSTWWFYKDQIDGTPARVERISHSGDLRALYSPLETIYFLDDGKADVEGLVRQFYLDVSNDYWRGKLSALNGKV